jgi:peptidoglycan hydrolase-like protein with peptidoglycan-binding domain
MRKSVVSIAAALAFCGVAVLPASGQGTKSAPQLRDLDMDAVPTLNQNDVRQVQQALDKRGISPGPIDGIYGPRTTDAVRSFQDRYGIKASGQVDNQTLFALGETELARSRAQ